MGDSRNPGALPRRLVLTGLAVAAAASMRPARAEIRGRVVVGKDGWLFGAWEDIRRVDGQRMRPIGPLFSRAVQAFRVAGIGLVVTIAPTRARTYQDMLPADFQPNADAVARYGRALNDIRQTGALVPDLADAMAQARHSQPDPVFLKTDTHWTGVGSEAAAIVTARDVLARFKLPQSAKHGPALGAYTTAAYPGEILNLMTPPERAGYPASETMKIRKMDVRYASAQGELIEEEASDLTIVGDSYMLPQYGFPQVLENRLDRPVSLAVKAQRIGPYRVLLDYLGSSQFKGQPRPKLLIWHHLEGSIDQMPEAQAWWGPGAMPADDFINALHRLLA